MLSLAKITTSNLDNTINTKLAAGESANASIISLTTSLAPKIASVNVASNTFTVLDDTAVNVGGGYIVVTGANFQSGATVLIDTVQASAVTYVNSTTLQVQVPARSAATYNLYVVNPDGGTGYFDGLSQVFDCPNLMSKSKYDINEFGEYIPLNDAAKMQVEHMDYLKVHPSNPIHTHNYLNLEDKLCMHYKYMAVKFGVKSQTMQIPYDWVYPIEWSDGWLLEATQRCES